MAPLAPKGGIDSNISVYPPKKSLDLCSTRATSHGPRLRFLDLVFGSLQKHGYPSLRALSNWTGPGSAIQVFHGALFTVLRVVVQ